MTNPDQPDWAAIRRRYETTQDAVDAIAAEAGVTDGALAYRRKKEGWRRRNPKPFPPPRKPAAVAAVAPADVEATGCTDAEPAAAAASLVPRRIPSSPAARRRLLDRLVAAISLKLEQLERRMTQDLASIAAGEATATDHERETRAIGALIDNLGKITEIETGLGRTSPAKRPAAATTDLADEAERCRRELAQRLARLVEAAGKDA